MKQQRTYSVKRDSEGFWFLENGKKIAMRKNKQWIAIEPGYSVHMSPDTGEFIVEYKGKQIRLQ
jgi:hypothetical protein